MSPSTLSIICNGADVEVPITCALLVEQSRVQHGRSWQVFAGFYHSCLSFCAQNTVVATNLVTSLCADAGGGAGSGRTPGENKGLG